MARRKFTILWARAWNWIYELFLPFALIMAEGYVFLPQLYYNIAYYSCCIPYRFIKIKGKVQVYAWGPQKVSATEIKIINRFIKLLYYILFCRSFITYSRLASFPFGEENLSKLIVSFKRALLSLEIPYCIFAFSRRQHL